MPDERFSEHLNHPVGRGHAVADGHAGTAGGSICGDLVRIDVRVEGETVVDAGFDASGCGALTAAASACVDLVRGAPLLDAARVGSADVAAELGGLSAGKLHAADLAADALARALGAAAVGQAELEARPRPRARRDERRRRQRGRRAPERRLGRRRDARALARRRERRRGLVLLGERGALGARRWRTGMGIPHFTVDLRDAFRAGVVQPWLDDHAAGLTPNPCVRCNGRVRLDAMADLATRLGAAALATGHYARVADGRAAARAPPTRAKDQSYMLAGLSPQTIARLRFPLGELTKDRVRAIAAEHGLPVAAKPDSQDLCFLAGTGRARFLERHGGIGDRPGAIVDRRGNVLGRHRGRAPLHRRPAARAGDRRRAEPLYVLGTDVSAGTVTVGPRAELATSAVALRDVVLHRGPEAVEAVRLRYRSPAVPCTLEGDTLALAEPFAGVAPGQVAVLLRGDAIVGSGTISS